MYIHIYIYTYIYIYIYVHTGYPLEVIIVSLLALTNKNIFEMVGFPPQHTSSIIDSCNVYHPPRPS